MSSISELKDRVETPHLILMSALIMLNASAIGYGYYRGDVGQEWLSLAFIFLAVSAWVLRWSLPKEFGR